MGRERLKLLFMLIMAQQLNENGKKVAATFSSPIFRPYAKNS